MTATAIVAVIGTTGAGKSQLALDLAARFDSEIISVDALQVYEGLDIATNKVTPDERARVPHHLIDVCVPPDEYVMPMFVRDATTKIEEVVRRGRLPILVGGTHYYLYSLLWNTVIDTVDESDKSDDDDDDDHERYSYTRLQQIDPVMAARYHPNDRRRVRRSIEVFEQHGRPHSAIVAEQQGGPAQLRYRVCFFWPAVESTALEERLDMRCDKMVENGLLDELTRFHARFPPPRDYAHGIFQAIGFKEFDAYLCSDRSNRDSATLQREGLDRLKCATKRYARKQVSWITHRLWHAIAQAPPGATHFHALDATDLSQWTAKVVEPAATALEVFLKDLTPVPLNPACPHVRLLLEHRHDQPSELVLRECTICHRQLRGDLEWSRHVASRGHRRARKRVSAGKKHFT